MQKIFCFLVSAILFISCERNAGKTQNPEGLAIAGTWKLLSGTLIENGDTITTDYSKGRSFIKIINDTHFAFLHHDLHKGKDSAAIYSSGGGTYILKDSIYTESLEYCSDRNWEGNDFEFVLNFAGDTLIQKGLEKIETEGVERLNIEKYLRVK